ncbi:MAG: FAD-dependent oxidoreductase [Myxococcota bacterium]
MMAWALVSLVILTVILMLPEIVRAAVRKRLGGFRHRYNQVDPQRPLRPEHRRSVAVIGAGLAGVSAAQALAERGFAVTLFEKEAQLGGKVGSWTTTLPDGSVEPVSHGFHAFFRHYYNLNRFLNRLGIRQQFKPIGDYMILRPKGDHMRFGQMDPTPVLNLISLRTTGFWRIRDIMFTKARDHMNVYMRYDEEKIFKRFDGETFDHYAERTHLPERLRLAFNVFARAFFSDESKLSTAELLKSIHFYYFGHDHGLAYDYPTADFQPAIWDPIEKELSRLEVDVKLEHPVDTMEATGEGWRVEGEDYDYSVIACDVAAAGPLLRKLRVPVPTGAVQPGQRYASLRLWIDRDLHHRTPPFVITDRDEVLDAVAIVHRMEREAEDYVRREGGGVVEMHCYAVPDDMDDDTLLARLESELVTFFPEIEGYKVRHRSGYVQQNFTSFHAGLADRRPGTSGGLPRLFLAGDWVKLPFPAMLMEAAFTSGLMAANAIFGQEGLREEPIDTVPPKGLFPF